MQIDTAAQPKPETPERIASIPGVRIMFPTESNAVFAELPLAAIEALRAKGWRFYTFIGAGGCRFMCSWDLQPDTVEALAADMRVACGA